MLARTLFILRVILFIQISTYVYADDTDWDKDPRDEIINKIKTVGIVSVLKDDLMPIELGLTVFQNKLPPKIHVKDDLNGYIQNTFGNLIKEKSVHVKYVPVSYDRENFEKAYKTDSRGYYTFELDRVNSELHQIFLKYDIDAIVLFTSRTCGDFVMNSSQILQSVGILRTNLFGMGGARSSFFCFGSYLIGRDNNVVLRDAGYTNQYVLSSDIWPIEREEPNDSDVKAIMKSIFQMIPKNANNHMSFFGLVPEEHVQESMDPG